MMYRNFFTLVIVISMVGSLYGQSYYTDPKYGADSASRRNCAELLSTMSSFAKINMFKDAYPSWEGAYNACPAASKNIYIHGAKILKDKIENASSDEEKDKNIDLLLGLYDSRITYFNQEGFVRGIQGMDLMRYRPSEMAKAKDYMKQSIELEGTDCNEAVLVNFVQASYILLKSGEINSAQFIEDYFKATAVGEAKRPNPRKESMLADLERIFLDSKAGDCETVIGMFEPKFAAEPQNPELLKKILSILTELDCKGSKLYANCAENLFAIEPSSDAAAALAGLFYEGGEYEKSKEYYLKAIGQETDKEKNAKYYFDLAKLEMGKFNNKVQSREYALKALEFKSGWGDPYILIGNLYAGSKDDCNLKLPNAVFWAAVDKFAKAKSVDPSVAENANNLINTYSKYLPNKEEAFFLGINDGDSFKVGCWINENTTARF